jgi:hypothetical protein
MADTDERAIPAWSGVQRTKSFGEKANTHDRDGGG